MRPRVSAEERFNRMVIKTDTCWNWQAHLDKNGYGVIWVDNKSIRAHRFSYEFYKSKIPEGLVIDHLCRNTSCVNPEHLEPVTNRENLSRGNNVAMINSRKTHCLNGHELKGLNLYIQKKTGKRYCRTCDNKRGKEYKKRLKCKTSK